MRDKDRIIGWLILLIALILCFTNLPLKPPHSDESGNGFFVNQIWETGFFTYDPANYHGPLLFYLLQISEKIFGFGIGSFRFVTALFALLSVWLILKNRNLLGRYTSFFAASAMALSPGFSFFGRSAIHEPLFVFFQILMVTGFLRTKEQGDRQGVLWSFAGLLGCMLLKETFVISLFSLLLAWGWSELSPRIFESLSGEEKKGQARTVRKKKSAGKRRGKQASRKGGEVKSEIQETEKTESPPKWALSGIDEPFLVKIIVVCAAVWFLLFTGFLHHRQGAIDFFTALTPWLKTGVGGSGHDKPFFYWLTLFARYEWAAAAGFVGALIGFWARSWKMRFFSALALVNWFVYSFIAYKTPWIIISILWPFLIVAGLWFESILVERRTKPAFWLALCVAAVIAGQSAAASVRLNFVHYSDPSEPYVYVQTKNDVKVIEDIIRKKVQSSPAYQNMKIQINLKDSWPFPWLFSRFPNIGFGDYRKAFTEKADVIFAEITHDDRDIDGLYWRRMIEVRDAREPVYVYLKKTFFEGMDLPGFGPSGAEEGKGT
ncbi:MAG TPA: flippase activity-associated protein Agl23 [Thermodesulfovibrionales bacterium]|nr:flippase activity-associated protein Agl23 [Thermodesulfovibrionales bacterium]